MLNPALHAELKLTRSSLFHRRRWRQKGQRWKQYSVRTSIGEFCDCHTLLMLENVTRLFTNNCDFAQWPQQILLCLKWVIYITDDYETILTQSCMKSLKFLLHFSVACLQKPTEGTSTFLLLSLFLRWPLSDFVSVCRDHSGGNKGLKKLHNSCRVYGNAADNIPGLTQ